MSNNDLATLLVICTMLTWLVVIAMGLVLKFW